ncbi:TetR/AcrR family transcriptional regulator [Maricurvus nonylphenolicus]|uniref:TetR/AcrR family transcriptional regulator n=1 Tax=Maricurvus nonylphenolicus TaxID=1008307 RepID=UPI0036F1F88E
MPKILGQEELAEREALIIKIACDIIEEEGFSGLTMDKIVAKVPYSKGSVYKLFNSTEEVMLAITNDGATTLLEFMHRARQYHGNSRARNLARAFAYHIYGQLYPVHFFCELQAISPAVREKASQRRLAHGIKILNEFKKLSKTFVADAIEDGDLTCPADHSPSRIANCSWSSEFGVTSYALAVHEDQRNIGPNARAQLETDIFWLANTYMDGLGWKPLSGSNDYKDIWQDIKKSLFADELRILALQG